MFSRHLIKWRFGRPILNYFQTKYNQINTQAIFVTWNFCGYSIRTVPVLIILRFIIMILESIEIIFNFLFESVSGIFKTDILLWALFVFIWWLCFIYSCPLNLSFCGEFIFYYFFSNIFLSFWISLYSFFIISVISCL